MVPIPLGNRTRASPDRPRVENSSRADARFDLLGHEAIPPHRRGISPASPLLSPTSTRAQPNPAAPGGRRWPSPSSSPNQRATGSRQCEKRGKIVPWTSPSNRAAWCSSPTGRHPASRHPLAVGKNALAVNDSGEQGRHCEPNAGSAAAQAGVRWCARRQAAHREDFEPGNANIDESGNAGGRREWTPTGSAERRRRTRDHHDLKGARVGTTKSWFSP